MKKARQIDELSLFIEIGKWRNYLTSIEAPTSSSLALISSASSLDTPSLMVLERYLQLL